MHMFLRSQAEAAKPDRSSRQDDEKLKENSAALVCGPDTVVTVDDSMASTIEPRSDERDANVQELENALEKLQRERLETQNELKKTAKCIRNGEKRNFRGK
jgi:hypothetical protein